jgi:hypothetical protein
MGLKKKGSVTPVTDKEEVVEKEEAVVEKAAPKKSAAKKKAAAPAPTQEEPLEVIEESTPETEEDEEPIQEPAKREQPSPVNESREVAETAKTEVATATKSGVLADAADAGFGGLEIGFGSFPILKIENGDFVLDGEGLESKTIHLNIRQSRSKFLIKQVVGSDEEPEFIYSYDGVLDLSGNSVDEWKAKQQADGFKVETKEYAEAVAEILEDNEFNGDFCILSIPPSGRSRFSGYVAQLKMQRGVYPGSVITLATVGKTIKKGNNSWNPWNFKFVETYDNE